MNDDTPIVIKYVPPRIPFRHYVNEIYIVAHDRIRWLERNGRRDEALVMASEWVIKETPKQ